MMCLRKAEHGEEDDKEAYCVLSLVNTEDEAEVLARLLAGHRKD